MRLPPPPMVQYLREPGGHVHLRASRSLFTLCHIMPTDEWEIVTTDRAPLCPECHGRITGFVFSIMRDGDEEPPPEGHEPCHNP